MSFPCFFYILDQHKLGNRQPRNEQASWNEINRSAFTFFNIAGSFISHHIFFNSAFLERGFTKMVSIFE